VGAVVGAAIVLGVVLATRSSGNHHVATGPSSASSPSAGATTTVAPPKDPGTRQLVDMLTAAQKQVFHARYQATSGPASVILELWHRPPSARRQTTQSAGANVVESTEVRTADSVVSCQRRPTQSWTCVKTGVDPNHDPLDVAFGTLSKLLAETSYVATDATLTNQPARCFVGTAPLPASVTGSSTPVTAPPRICFNQAGIPLLIDAGDGPVTATVIDDNVPDSSFVPPAQPVGG
jgi:hypothetical protein